MLKVENRFNRDGVFSKKIRAGRRRTYFFDVRTTRSNDYYITITESKRRYEHDGYERHKLHLYKEDFNKFLTGLQETVDHVKTELMPEYDFDEYTRKPEQFDYNDNSNSRNTYTEEATEVKSESNYEDNDDNGEEESAPDDDEDLKWD